MSKIVAILIGILIGTSFGFAVMFPAIICSEYQDAKYIDYEPGGSIHWYMPVLGDDGRAYQLSETTDPGISEDDFRAALSSPMCRKIILGGGHGLSDIPGCPQSFLDAFEDAVSRTGKDIREHSDYEICVLISAFVRTGIEYADDRDVHGCRDYAASPVETLYLGKGDCEDVSILFVSMARAYGIDCVPISYDGHCTAGVRIEGYDGENKVGDYSIVECTESMWFVYDLWSPDCGEGRVLGKDVSDGIVDAYLRYCDRTIPYNPILYISRMLLRTCDLI